MNKIRYILVAEDDTDDKNLLQAVFDECQYDVPLQFVSNGLELLQYLEQVKDNRSILHFPNFILLDLNMPKMDGRQALLEIKTDPAYRKIPIIVFSTTKNEDEINRCYELGANTYIVKPSSYKDFLITIGTITDYWLKSAAIPNSKLQ